MQRLQYDLYRITGELGNRTFVKTFLTQRAFRFICYYRLQKESTIWHPVIRLLAHRLNGKMSVEIPSKVIIGKGFLMLHPYGITINSNAVIGDNFTILKGATIGNTKTGENPGSPIIGNNVYLGLNSTVVGGVHIGNNVMIAANTFVNFDVPDDSIVLGSPGIVHPKAYASRPYIINSITDLSIGE